jgi:hypothetical protein
VKITGSRVHRVWKCPASAVLPQTEIDDGRFEPARAKGQAVHKFLERVKAIGKPAALAEAPAEILPLLEALDLESLPVGLACEVAFAWNWKTSTARELGRGDALPRKPDGAIDYDRLGVDWTCEIPCTLDVVGIEENMGPGGHGGRNVRGYVGDYKSGHAKYPAPDMFGQTLLGALCVRSVWGCDDVVVELIHIHDNGGHHAVRRTVGEWELDGFAGELAEAMEVVEDRVRCMDAIGPLSAEEVPPPVEGSHCDYCPAYRACPAKLALVRSIPDRLVQLGVRPGTLPDKDGVEQHALVLTPNALTASKAAQAWASIELIEDVLGRAKEELCGLAAFQDIPLPDGRVLGRLVTERRGTNGKIAAELLEKRYGREERDARVDISVTLAALRQAVVAHLKPGEKIEKKDGSGVYDRLLGELERLGGLETKVTDAVRPHVPKRKRLT